MQRSSLPNLFRRQSPIILYLQLRCWPCKGLWTISWMCPPRIRRIPPNRWSCTALWLCRKALGGSSHSLLRQRRSWKMPEAKFYFCKTVHLWCRPKQKYYSSSTVKLMCLRIGFCFGSFPGWWFCQRHPAWKLVHRVQSGWKCHPGTDSWSRPKNTGRLPTPRWSPPCWHSLSHLASWS